MKTVKQLVYEMLIEGTGKALCDSGGAYGRHWERNQKKTIADFESEEAVSFEKDWGYTISVFHYLTDSADLELDAICEDFNRINTQSDNWDHDGLYGVSSEAGLFLHSLDAKCREPFNTYNGGSSLSQVLQGARIDINSEDYLLLQIHQGCDVRGGYTDARLFKCSNEDHMGYLPIESVYGIAILENGEEVQVDNMYNGWSLTTENGQEVENIVSAELSIIGC